MVILCLSLQLASDEESVQSFNVEDSADHTGKQRLPRSVDCHKPCNKTITDMANSVTFKGKKTKRTHSPNCLRVDPHSTCCCPLML